MLKMGYVNIKTHRLIQQIFKAVPKCLSSALGWFIYTRKHFNAIELQFNHPSDIYSFLSFVTLKKRRFTPSIKYACNRRTKLNYVNLKALLEEN